MPPEIEYARFIEPPTFIKKEQPNVDLILTKNADKIAKIYAKIEKDALSANQKEYAQWLSRKKSLESNTCQYCKAPLVMAMGILTCSRNNTTGYHTTFWNIANLDHPPRVRMSTTWMNSIINECGLKNFVKVKQLFQYLISNGFEDLRQKYGYSSSDINFNGLIKANQRSKEQEQKALVYLKSIYKKVLYQPCIAYKLKGQKDTFCRPDFIAAEKDIVFVFDAKLDIPNDEQMDLYIELITFITLSKNDSRKIEGSFIMYENTGLPSKYKILIIPAV